MRASEHCSVLLRARAELFEAYNGFVDVLQLEHLEVGHFLVPIESQQNGKRFHLAAFGVD